MSSNPDEVFLMRMRSLRKQYGYTQQYIASYLCISQNTYSLYESGKRQISTHLLIRLALLYHTSTDYILGLTDNPIPHRDIHDDTYRNSIKICNTE